MSDRLERSITEYEAARNDAEDRYFEARPQLDRTIARVKIFEAGFRMAWEQLKGFEYDSLSK